MAYFPDLSLYSYSRSQDAKIAYNVGWLSSEYSYPQGNVPQEFIDRLWIYCGIFVNPMRGYSRCELCKEPTEWPVTVTYNGKSLNLGSAEIRVIDKDSRIYASPNLIFHYVFTHKYLPPKEFINAVLTGWLPDSQEYNSLKMKYQWRTL